MRRFGILVFEPDKACNGGMKFELLRTPIREIVVDDSACEVDDLAPCGGVQVTVPGTEGWAMFVRRAVDSDWTGIEALGAFDGPVADAVRSNHAAFGQQVGDTVMSVRTWDLEADAQRTFAAVDCQFGPGASVFQEQCADDSGEADSLKWRYEILDVNFLFRQGDLTRPISDASLAALLNVELGQRVPLRQAADAIA